MYDFFRAIELAQMSAESKNVCRDDKPRVIVFLLGNAGLPTGTACKVAQKMIESQRDAEEAEPFPILSETQN